MCDTNDDGKLLLKVMVNQERTKVLFAEADSHFVDVLLSFLTLPLGRIVKVLEKHYADDEAPSIGSLSSLYHSLQNLDSVHFWTAGAKLALLNPITSFEAEYQTLKLDITDSPPAEDFYCSWCGNRFRSVSMYYDQVNFCLNCRNLWSVPLGKKAAEILATSGDANGTLTKNTTAFIISDDLLISTYMTGLLQTITILGITDMDAAKLINVSFGHSEIMNLLKASLTSQTPLSDLILNGKRQMISTTEKSKPETSSHQVVKEETSNSKKMILKVMVQKSTGKLLYAQAEEDFVELMFSFLVIPVGQLESLLAGKTCFKSIDNLHRSVADLIDDKYFKISDTKSRLIKPKLPHGYISKNHVLPLAEECLPSSYSDNNITYFSSTKFPKGQGIYINGPITYHVTDDLTVTPFSIETVISSLSELKISMSDVKEVHVQIGLQEALSILRGSLTSTSALTNGLLSHLPKPEI